MDNQAFGSNNEISNLYQDSSSYPRLLFFMLGAMQPSMSAN